MAEGYRRLTYGSRCRIYALRKSGESMRGIARLLGFSASTVSRELRRNCSFRGYRMKQAQRFSEARRPLAALARTLTADYGKEFAGHREMAISFSKVNAAIMAA